MFQTHNQEKWNQEDLKFEVQQRAKGGVHLQQRMMLTSNSLFSQLSQNNKTATVENDNMSQIFAIKNSVRQVQDLFRPPRDFASVQPRAKAVNMLGKGDRMAKVVPKALRRTSSALMTKFGHKFINKHPSLSVKAQRNPHRLQVPTHRANQPHVQQLLEYIKENQPRRREESIGSCSIGHQSSLYSSQTDSSGIVSHADKNTIPSHQQPIKKNLGYKKAIDKHQMKRAVENMRKQHIYGSKASQQISKQFEKSVTGDSADYELSQFQATYLHKLYPKNLIENASIQSQTNYNWQINNQTNLLSSTSRSKNTLKSRLDKKGFSL